MKALTPLFTLLLLTCTCFGSDEIFCDWLPSDSYQALVNKNVRDGLYIKKVEGRKREAGDEFRAVFAPLPEYTREWWSHHGLSEKEYKAKSKKYKKAGLKEVWVQYFEDKEGLMRYQATWIKR